MGSQLQIDVTNDMAKDLKVEGHREKCKENWQKYSLDRFDTIVPKELWSLATNIHKEYGVNFECQRSSFIFILIKF